MANRAFEYFLRKAAPTLARLHGEELARAVIAQTRREYERVRPEVPDIGGLGNVFQPVMAVNGWIVALHRAMKAHGKTAADSVEVCQIFVDRLLRRFPSFVLHLLGRLWLSAPARRYLERQARRSQERRYPADFVWKVERGRDGEVSLVFDECAVNKWYDAQDVRDLKPYCNFVDVTYSRLMNMGVDATHTIGLGFKRCALRFKRGRETIVPPSLEGIVEKV